MDTHHRTIGSERVAMVVVILHERAYSRNGDAFQFPLLMNRRLLAREYGVVLRFTTRTDALLDGDVLIVHAKVFRDWWAVDGGARILAWLAAARTRVGRIVWVDTSDGTGTTHFRVLPLVDRYIKNQLLRDRRAYQRTLYGGRVYTDFLHRTYGIRDDDPGESHLNHPPSDTDLAKLTVGWHYGFAHYGRFGEYLGQAWFRASMLPRWFPHTWTPPSVRRPIPVSCRIGLRYSRSTIAYARQMLAERLAARGVQIGRVPKAAYFLELRQALIAVSPFGYGEICYRDFEAMLSGAAVLKQDMAHLETWPNLWVAGETYLPFAWDGSDFDERLDAALSDRQRTTELAAEAQRRYRFALAPAGQEEFCHRFVSLVVPPTAAPSEHRREMQTASSI